MKMRIQFEPGDRVMVTGMYTSVSKTDTYQNWVPMVGTIANASPLSEFDYGVRFDEVPPVVIEKPWILKDSIWGIDQHQIDIFTQCCMEALADDPR